MTLRSLRLFERLTSLPTWYWTPGDRAPFNPEDLFVYTEPDDDDRWQRAKDRAATALEGALGGRAARRLELGLVFVYVSADMAVSARLETGMLAHVAESAEFDSGDITVIIDIDPAAPGTDEALATELAVRAARQLLDCPAPWTDAQRDGLRVLIEMARAT